MGNSEYEAAAARYAAVGVDVGQALATLASVPLSVHCWQGDDVTGFEQRGAALIDSGLAVTGSHPGRARNAVELRQDLDKAYSLIPGRHRLNLHAMYGETCGADRNGIEPAHFRGWVAWATERQLGLDFNATLFAHAAAADGFTHSSPDETTRRFWVEHVRRCRDNAAYMGRELGTPCIHNLWVPDGEKDMPLDRWKRRAQLKRSLDEVYEQAYPAREMKDALESKLWGIGSEAFVVGSHEFYLGYALAHGKMVCLDMGHFHPTESVADKVSAILLFSDELLLHLSRGVRWDSDHVVVLSDELVELMREVVRAGALQRVHLALDFFDAGINRVGAWVIGARAVLKALLVALLEPADRLQELDRFGRLALYEEMKTMAFGAVWDQCCVAAGVPVDRDWPAAVRQYERDVLSRRS